MAGNLPAFIKKKSSNGHTSEILTFTNCISPPPDGVDYKIKVLCNYCLCNVLSILVACAGKRLIILFYLGSCGLN
jgi:hypothetical protein